LQTWANQTFEKLVSKFTRSAALAAEQDLIPYRSENGRWVGSPFDGNGWWTSGFWPGLMLLLYADTKDERFLTEARRAEALLTGELTIFNALSHDMGFMYLLSAGVDCKLTGDAAARRDTLHAATLLAGRFNPAGGFLRAWNGDRYGWAIIDCMMNLPLLYRASRDTGDPRFTQIARIHADTTLRAFVRPDGSCNHIVILDPVTGQVLEKPAGQGYAVGSSWSRGQAWALYGFTLSHRWTGDPRYLEAACGIADYFIANIRADGLTDCDFRQPAEPEKLDNIAGACAACGLLELAKAAPEEKKAARYQTEAVRMLRALDTLCADWSDASPGVLQKCTAAYHDNNGAGTHVNILYGDYFFTEAVAKLRGSDPMFWG